MSPDYHQPTSLTGGTLPGLEWVNPGIELCKSFGMIVEAGGGRGGSPRLPKSPELPKNAKIENHRPTVINAYQLCEP